MGLVRNGRLFTKSSDKGIFGSFSVPLSHIFAKSTYKFTAKIRKFDTVFIPNQTKISMEGCVDK